MNSWERFNESKLPDKKDFYSCLNMEDITDVDYKHRKRVFREFKMNNLGDYHDLYVQSDTLLIADVFENFRNMCLKYMSLIQPIFFFTTRFCMASLFKNDCSRIRITHRP